MCLFDYSLSMVHNGIDYFTCAEKIYYNCADVIVQSLTFSKCDWVLYI